MNKINKHQKASPYDLNALAEERRVTPREWSKDPNRPSAYTLDGRYGQPALNQYLREKWKGLR